MTTINSNGGLFNVQNSTNIPLNVGEVFEGLYSSTLNYSTIEVSVKCDTFYSISIIYSPDSNNDEYSEMQEIEEVLVETSFYKFEPKMRYFKIRIENIDTEDQELLSVNCIQKSSFVYSVTDVGSSVSIASPLNLDGSVRVGGSLTLGGSVDANITNASLDVNVTNAIVVSGAVDSSITNFPSGFDCYNLPLSIVGGGVIITATDDIPVGGTILNLSYAELQAINTNTSATNTKIDTTNTKLDTTNTNLTNTYNLLNTKGSANLWNNANTGAGGFSSAVNLSDKKISNMTFMGNCSGATLLTVQFSNDGVTYYDSQYSYNLSASGNLGFNINGCPNYLRMKSSNDVLATVIVNYC